MRPRLNREQRDQANTRAIERRHGIARKTSSRASADCLALHDMVDAIREILGKTPLYTVPGDAPSPIGVFGDMTSRHTVTRIPYARSESQRLTALDETVVKPVQKKGDAIREKIRQSVQRNSRRYA